MKSPLLFLVMTVILYSCKAETPRKINTPYQPGTFETSTPATSDPGQTSPSPAPVVTGPAGQNPGDYLLTFSEDFEGGSLNKLFWNDSIWYESPNPAQNYKISEGRLKIWPQRDASNMFFNRTIDTDGKFYMTYGFIEMEAKLPYGKGTWPAFWLFNHIGDDRPEIDIMEAYAGGGPDSGWSTADMKPTAFAATIWPNGHEAPSAGHKTLQLLGDLSAGFHKYGLLWEPNKMTFYFDGQAFYSTSVTMNRQMYIILDLWFGSASGTPDQSTPTGELNSFEINYVKVWKKK